MVLNKIQMYLAVAFGVIVAVLAAFFKGRSQGKQEEQHEQLELAFDKVQQARKVERDIAATSDADVDKRLSKWYRD